ncbi:MAG: diadenylate cyclase CdaA [Bacteroidales bacterium]
MPDFLLPAFIQVRFLDIIDVLLVALLLYNFYSLVKGTGALNIFVGILSIYLVWWLVRIFEMEVLSAILGQFIRVGVLALIIVFQPEIRRFLLFLGTRGIINKSSRTFLRKLWHFDQGPVLNISPIVNACERLAEGKTGALIVITKNNLLEFFAETGEELDAKISEQLLENIFYKNSPLHDGAVIISNNKIKAARCVLPVSENPFFPTTLGLRHRAAAGITEQSDAIALVVSEQTGRITWCKEGQIKRNIKPVQLKEFLAKEFSSNPLKTEESPPQNSEL